MKALATTIFLLCFVTAAFGQPLAERGTPLDHLEGSWVMTGTIAGNDIVHDVSAEWVLGGHYLYVHDLARERDAEGNRVYEARIYIGWDEAHERLVCMWLDITGGGGLVPDGFGYARHEEHRIPFVWGAASDSGIHNTFTYLPGQDRWTWDIDNVRNGEPSEFARVTLTRTVPAPPTADPVSEPDEGILDAIARLSSATAPGGGGVEAYAAVLADDFSRWTLSSEEGQDREALIDGIRQWLDDGWRVASRESQMIDSTVLGDRAFTYRVVTETYRDPAGELSTPSTFALEETWQQVAGKWLLQRAMVYPVTGSE